MLYQKLLVGERPYFVRLSHTCRGFEEHRHPEIELYYCFKGSRSIIINKENHRIQEGDFVIISSMASHKFLPGDNADILSLVIDVGPALLGRYFDPFAKTTFPNPVFRLNPQNHKEIIDLLHETAFACENQSDFSELVIKGNLYKICAYILREFVTENTSVNKSKALRSVSNIEKALEHIYTNYNKELRIEDIAVLCGYSKSNFCKIFKNITGTTFHSFLNNHRIKIACNLLRETNLSLDDIASQVGFADAKTLCRVFKAIISTTPGEFRKNGLR